jgi:hypothetical protein
MPATRGKDRGLHLTTLFGNHAVSIVATTEIPAADKKHGWLPLLIVLFLISYGLMTMLIVEQGQTIESQRVLIRELFRDSTELSTLKKKGQEGAARSQAIQAPVIQAPSTQTPSTQAPTSQAPSTQAPSTQARSTQAPTSQAPSSQAGPQHRTQNEAGKQKPFRMPSKPASDLVDDVRTLITI